MNTEKLNKLTMLVTKYQNGEKDVFNEIYKLTDSELREYAYGRGNPFRSSASVEDILQETYIKIVTNIDKLQNAASYMGWAKTIFINTMYSEFRPKKYEEFSVAEIYENEMRNEVEVNLRPKRRSIVEEVIFRDNVERAMTILADLPKEQQETFIAFYIEGKLIRDIAMEMACPEGTVKSRLYSSRAKLRECMGC